MIKIIAVTACPTGVAHTYMAAEAIEQAAKVKGWECCVETQGSIGIENELQVAQIEAADLVILTKDIAIQNEERFKNKKILRVTSGEAVRHAAQIMNKIDEHLGL